MSCSGPKHGAAGNSPDSRVPAAAGAAPRVKALYVTDDAVELPAVGRATGAFGLEARVVTEINDVPPEDRNGETVVITTSRGRVLTPCPGTKGHRCCRYQTIDLYLGCTIGCTYCIMQSYLNYSPNTVYADTAAACAGIDALGRTGRHYRVGTGEVGDSLLFDEIFRLSEELVAAAAPYPNLRLELKTKTACVDHLLTIPNKGNAVIGFSMAPQSRVSQEEPYAASITDRVAAAERGAAAGFGVAYHLDPIITSPDPNRNWIAEYRKLIGLLPDIEPAWVSMGTVRFPPAFRRRVAPRPYLFDEFVPAKDGKLRYVQRRRIEVYNTVLAMLRDRFSAPIYLCMESDAVWRRVFGALPGELPELRGIFSTRR